MLKKYPQQVHLFSQKVPALAQQVSLWQVNSSTKRVGIYKKALRKDPPATLPQCLVNNL
jgi:hypothetical protein